MFTTGSAPGAPSGDGGLTKEKHMRKFILMALAGTAIALAAPQFASATPLSPGSGLTTAADSVSATEQVRHRRWHRWHHRCRHHRC
jgi:hypothetical protein